jgi:hypothetical protein
MLQRHCRNDTDVQKYLKEFSRKKATPVILSSDNAKTPAAFFGGRNSLLCAIGFESGEKYS